LEGTDLLLDLLCGFMILHIIGFSKKFGRLVGNLSLFAHKHSNFVSAPFAKLVFVVLRFEGAFADVGYVLNLKLFLLLVKLSLCFVDLLLLWVPGWLLCLGLLLA